MQKIFNSAKRKRESNAHHDRQTDNPGASLEVAKWGVCLSSRNARWSPCPPQQVLF
jgi:hypothetical protein